MKISVLLPTKNRPELLVRALDAMLAQDGPDFEVIIENGGGELAPIDDDRVTVLDRADASSTGALNHAAEYATGDLMHFAADDDIIQAGTFAQAASIDAEWTYAAIRFLVGDQTRTKHGPIAWDAEHMARANICPAPTVFWTRRIWDELGPFDESLRYVSDYEMWARFGSRHAPAVRDHVDYLYQVWDGSTTSQRAAEMDAEVAVLHDRWARIGFGNRDAVKGDG